jgi:hypothetical protein
MPAVNLSQSAVATLDGSGNGTARLGPVSSRETWKPQVASVKTNQVPGTITSEAQCRIYAGPDTSDAYFVDGTLSGSTGDSTANVAGQEISCGEYVWAVWTGGDPGAQGRLNVQGDKILASPPARG